MTRGPLSNALCERLGIRHPVVLAGMAGGPTTPELVAAVSEAGGLGTFGLTGMTTDAVRDAVAPRMRADGEPDRGQRPRGAGDAAGPGGSGPARWPSRPCARELGLPATPAPGRPAASPAELVEAGLAAGARVVSVGLGDPSEVRDLARAAGAPLIAMASSVEDAVRAVAAGAE